MLNGGEERASLIENIKFIYFCTKNLARFYIYKSETSFNGIFGQKIHIKSYIYRFKQ